MSDSGKEGLLGRWSRLKRESAANSESKVPAADRDKTEMTSDEIPDAIPTGAKPVGDRDRSEVQPSELPSIDELNPDSDFEAFMDPGVDDDVRRSALKTLFRDPHFNITDGLDVYAEDYTKLEKLTPAMVAALRYAQRNLFDKNDETDSNGGEETNAPVELASRDPEESQSISNDMKQERTESDTIQAQEHNEERSVARNDDQPAIDQRAMKHRSE